MHASRESQPAEEGHEEEPQPRFALGLILGTPGAIEALAEAEQDPAELLLRHVTGDWGQLDDEDKQQNELSVEHGYRILSAYELENAIRIWVITEADRSATTILLPSEY